MTNVYVLQHNLLYFIYKLKKIKTLIQFQNKKHLKKVMYLNPSSNL